jgi:hypothetical protein
MFCKIGRKYYNPDHIRHVYIRRDDKAVIYSTDKNAAPDEIEIDTYWLDVALGTIIPAQPGWKVVKPIYDSEGGKAEAFLEDIIAFVIAVGEDRVNCTPIPITASGIPAESSVWAIVSPSGLVEQQFIATCDSIQDWIDLINEEKEAAKKLAEGG